LLGPLAGTLATIVLLGTIDWWHVDDAEAVSLPSFHKHDAHRPVLQPNPPADTDSGEHCYVCHWLRTFQNGLRTAVHHVPANAATFHVQLSSNANPCDRAAALLPARAPPA
jgi:hypothetical protein